MKRNQPKINKPSIEEVEKYQVEWNKLENYVYQESSLQKLFTKTYNSNTDLDEVLIKVCALNDFYSTNIFVPLNVAKRIVELDIDDNLDHGDLSIVNKIAKVKVNNGKTINFYSFATKYCSHHSPENYPIYDSYVEKLLMHLNRRDGFCIFKKTDLKNYGKYKSILLDFRKFYGLDKFNLKELDRYLWLLGKRHFKRHY